MAAPPETAVQMQIKGLLLDPSSNLPVVILRNTEDDLLLPIWIGVFEANAIALQIEGVETPRPMTHDLMRNLLEGLGAEVVWILISDLQESTFYARIQLVCNGREVEIDSRPSDALALALRVEAPIFVLRSVLETAQAIDLAGKLNQDERIKKFLEDAGPEDLGEYEM